MKILDGEDGDINDWDPSASLFDFLEGLPFWCKGESLVLNVGHYSNGRGAILVCTAEGEPYSKLTVNLSVRQAEDEFFVKSQMPPYNAYQKVLLNTGLFEEVPGDIGAGYDDGYAKRWRFAKLFPATEHGEYRVEQPALMKAIKDAHESEVERLRAQDAAHRLRGEVLIASPTTPTGRLVSRPNIQNIPLATGAAATVGRVKKP